MDIKTKYNIGDEVWVMVNNKPTYGDVLQIDIHIIARANTDNKYFTSKSYYYISGYGGNEFFEKDVFFTKGELINSL